MMPPIALYHHAKNYELSITDFQENVKKPEFLTLNPQIKIFSNMEPHSNDLPY